MVWVTVVQCQGRRELLNLPPRTTSQQQEKRIFTNFHRQLFCWIDKWIDLSMEDIRRMEDETQRELEAVSVGPHAAAVPFPIRWVWAALEGCCGKEAPPLVSALSMSDWAGAWSR